MYNAFFNLRENPFALNPNPKFFFWDKVHSDAMKYLMFGIKNKEGFIEILGEAGTGKTLLCLMLLKQLDENTHCVLFLNPPMDETEFLQTVIGNLKLAPTSKSRKSMIEAISEFASQESSQGRNIVFILDEAQHLSADVLEKVRLLTNSPQINRPIQVILIGQPELDDRLRSHNLRQLYQRITIRFRLKPLSKKEMGEYIDFRLKQARSSQTITFTRGSMRMIYWFSKGNPRLVNIICDKALMAASLDQTARISTSLIKAAMKSALAANKPFSTLQSLLLYPRMVAASVVLVVALAGGFLWKTERGFGEIPGLISSVFSAETKQAETKPPVASYVAVATPEISPAPKIETAQKISDDIVDSNVADKIADKMVESGVADRIATMMMESGVADKIADEVVKKVELDLADDELDLADDELDERVTEEMEQFGSIFDEDGIMIVDRNRGNYNLSSLVTLLARWGITGLDEDQISWWGKTDPRKFSFSDIALQYGLEASFLKTSLDELRIFNVPAILLEVYDTTLGRSCSMVLTGMDRKRAVVLHPGRGKITLKKSELEKNWGKKAIVLWRNPDKLPSRLISPLMGEMVLEKVWDRLKAYESATGSFPDNPGDAWVAIKQAVEDFQKKKGLRTDGIIGVRTRIKLYTGHEGDTSPTLLVLSKDL